MRFVHGSDEIVACYLSHQFWKVEPLPKRAPQDAVPWAAGHACQHETA